MIVPQHLQRLCVNLCKVPLQYFCVKHHYNQYIFNNNNIPILDNNKYEYKFSEMQLLSSDQSISILTAFRYIPCTKVMF